MKTIKIDGIIGWTFFANDLDRLMDDSEESYKVILDSPGGYILEGFSIYNTLQRFKADGGKFEIEIDFAGSMTSIIAMAGDKVSMRENSSLMFVHRVQGVAIGDAEEMYKTGDDMIRLEDKLKNIYLDKAGDRLNLEKITDLMEKDTWLSADEAKRYGLADKVIKNQEKSKAQLNLGGGITLDISSLSKACARLNPLHSDIESADNLKTLEGVLRDAGRLSRNDAKALVSRVNALSQREVDPPRNPRDVDPQLSDEKAFVERLESLIKQI